MRPSLPSHCGCYSLTLDGVVYVGASSLTRRRKLNHMSKLRRGVHPCGELQAAYNRTGQSPRFKLLEECNQRSLGKREAYWVKKLKAANLPGAGVRFGHKAKPEDRKKISLALKAYHQRKREGEK